MIQPEFVMDMICEYFRISKDDLLGKCRKRKFALPRQICIYLIKQNTKISYVNLSKAMKGKKRERANHATLIHSVAAITDLMETDKNIAYQIQELQAMLDVYQMKYLQEQERAIRERRDKFLEAQVQKAIRKMERIRNKEPETPKVIRMQTLSEHEKIIQKYL